MSTINTSAIGTPSSSSVVGTANIAGIASGINYNSIVSQLMAVEQNKVTLLQSQQNAILTQQNALTQLNGYLSTLSSQAASMADSSNFFSYTSTLSSNTATDPNTLLSVQTSASATPASHSIVVSQLAQAMKVGSSAAVTDSTSTAATSSTAALGLAGSFTINGQTVSVTTSDSLQNIADTINQMDTGSSATGVTASVINVGTNDYRLVLSADKTGATGFALAGADLTGALAGLQLGTPQTILAGQDAQLTVDGYAMTRSTNSISDAISGLTLNLTKADAATTVTLNVGVDTQAATQNIQTFVDDYNKVMDFINQQMQFNSSTNTSGPLASDSVVRSIESQLSSTILQDIPGLPSGSNNLALIGVAPDSTGKLTIDSTTLNNVLSTDPAAVQKIFSATGSSSNSALSFLTYGTGTVSGSYAVNVTQAATQASVTGTTDLSTGLAAAETLALTDGSGQVASVGLTAGQSLSSIVTALNTEFSKTYTQQVKMGTALTAGGSPANSATTLASLGLGVQAGDTISISGTDRYGSPINYAYTVIDPNTDTVGSLLSGIQYAFNQQVTAGIDASGNITLTDNQSGASKLSLNMVANNEGGGTLNFGTESVVQEGRFAMSLSASASGNFLKLENTSFGSGSTFTVNQTSGGTPVDNLGIANTTYTGTDVAGTIGGFAATGSGQILTGSTGNVSGLALMYTGSTTGSVGTMAASLGIGATFDNMVNTFSDPVLGLVQGDINSMQSNYDDIGANISAVQAQMNQEQATLLASFQSMEAAISSLNVSSQYLSQVTQMLASSSSTGSSTSSFK